MRLISSEIVHRFSQYRNIFLQSFYHSDKWSFSTLTSIA